EQAATGPRIRVFRLKHLDPDEARAVLSVLLATSGGGPPMGMGGAGGAGMMGPGGGMMGAGGPMMGGPPGGLGVPGKGGGGMGSMMMAGGGAPGAPTLRLAVDGRTGCLIARGTAAELRAVAEYLAVLDQADGKATTRLKRFRAFRLKYAGAQEVASILNE